MREAYEKDENFRNEFDQLSLTGKGPDIPDTLRKYFPSCGIQKQAAIPERKGIIACSLVRNLVSRGNLPRYGHIIPLRGFGIVRLAELKMSQGLRRITMLQVELGSMPEGSVMVASAKATEPSGSNAICAPPHHRDNRMREEPN